jgi:hypothetical protein
MTLERCHAMPTFAQQRRKRLPYGAVTNLHNINNFVVHGVSSFPKN